MTHHRTFEAVYTFFRSFARLFRHLVPLNLPPNYLQLHFLLLPLLLLCLFLHWRIPGLVVGDGGVAGPTSSTEASTTSADKPPTLQLAVGASLLHTPGLVQLLGAEAGHPYGGRVAELGVVDAVAAILLRDDRDKASPPQDLFRGVGGASLHGDPSRLYHTC